MRVNEDTLTAIGALGTVAAGAGLGALAVKTLRTIQALLRAGKKSEAERTLEAMQTKERAQIDRWLDAQRRMAMREEEPMIDWSKPVPAVRIDEDWLMRNRELVEALSVNGAAVTAQARGMSATLVFESEAQAQAFAQHPLFAATSLMLDGVEAEVRINYKLDESRVWPESLRDVQAARDAYSASKRARNEVVRANAARRIRRQIVQPVPELLPKPLFPFAFDADGTYIGLVIGGPDNVPDGATVKWKHSADESLAEAEGAEHRGKQLDTLVKPGEWNIRVSKAQRTQWGYFVTNLQGGGSGTNTSYRSANKLLASVLARVPNSAKPGDKVWVMVGQADGDPWVAARAFYATWGGAAESVDERDTDYGKLAQDLLSAVGDAKATQARFLKTKGLTIEQARKLPKREQAALQAAYASWLQKAESLDESLGEASRWGRYLAQLDESDKFIVTDRYAALGIPHPDPKTMCRGQCEGTGIVPISASDESEPWRTLWLKAEEAKGPSEDGYHFVKCPDCAGTGKAESIDEARVSGWKLDDDGHSITLTDPEGVDWEVDVIELDRPGRRIRELKAYNLDDESMWITARDLPREVQAALINMYRSALERDIPDESIDETADGYDKLKALFHAAQADDSAQVASLSRELMSLDGGWSHLVSPALAWARKGRTWDAFERKMLTSNMRRRAESIDESREGAYVVWMRAKPHGQMVIGVYQQRAVAMQARDAEPGAHVTFVSGVKGVDSIRAWTKLRDAQIQAYYKKLGASPFGVADFSLGDHGDEADEAAPSLTAAQMKAAKSKVREHYGLNRLPTDAEVLAEITNLRRRGMDGLDYRLQRLSSSLQVGAHPIELWTDESIDEDVRDALGRQFTEQEFDVLYRAKSPNYAIDREAWRARHFTEVETNEETKKEWLARQPKAQVMPGSEAAHARFQAAGAAKKAAKKKGKGRWVTTDSGHRIYIEGGKVTKGNPHVLKAMQRDEAQLDESRLLAYMVNDEVTKARREIGTLTQANVQRWLAANLASFDGVDDEIDVDDLYDANSYQVQVKGRAYTVLVGQELLAVYQGVVKQEVGEDADLPPDVIAFLRKLGSASNPENLTKSQRAEVNAAMQGALAPALALIRRYAGTPSTSFGREAVKLWNKYQAPESVEDAVAFNLRSSEVSEHACATCAHNLTELEGDMRAPTFGRVHCGRFGFEPDAMDVCDEWERDETRHRRLGSADEAVDAPAAVRKVLIQNPDRYFDTHKLAMAAHVTDGEALVAASELVAQGTAEFKRGEGYRLAGSTGMPTNYRKPRILNQRTHDFSQADAERTRKHRQRTRMGEAKVEFEDPGLDFAVVRGSGDDLEYWTGKTWSPDASKAQRFDTQDDSDAEAEKLRDADESVTSARIEALETTTSGAVGGFRPAPLAKPCPSRRVGSVSDVFAPGACPDEDEDVAEARKPKKSDKLRDQDEPEVLGYKLDRESLAPRRNVINTSAPGDYGSDPLGDGKFRMVPSGDIVDFEERNRRLKRKNESMGVGDTSIEVAKRGSKWYVTHPDSRELAFPDKASALSHAQALAHREHYAVVVTLGEALDEKLTDFQIEITYEAGQYVVGFPELRGPAGAGYQNEYRFPNLDAALAFARPEAVRQNFIIVVWNTAPADAVATVGLSRSSGPDGALPSPQGAPAPVLIPESRLETFVLAAQALGLPMDTPIDYAAGHFTLTLPPEQAERVREMVST